MRRALRGRVLAVALAVAPGVGAVAAEAPKDSASLGAIVSATTPEALAPPVRPRVALVLSGGGARGAAHVGVLKVLEEMQVVPDVIVGTSMGSIVGGFYAAGVTPQELEVILSSVEWAGLFTDRVRREERTFRRKKDDDLYLIQAKLRFRGWKPWLPAGVLGGKRLELFLEALTHNATIRTDFDDFPIPYRAVAADIVSGEAVVIGEGSLATAMRASMSIAGAFPPVEMGGRRLVDGGAVANLPVGVAKALGAERIIAVDISSPLAEAEQLGSFLSMVDQTSGLLTVGNRIEDVARLGPDDVYIRPELGDISFSDFKRAGEAVSIGEAAAREVADRLRAFSATDEAWAAFRRAHKTRPDSGGVVEEVTLTNASEVDDAIFRERLPIVPGDRIDPETFPDQVMRLFALDFSGAVRASFPPSATGERLALRIDPKPYGRNSLQFGLSFYDDFDGNADYGLTVRHQMLPVNRKGGEWVNVGQIGSAAVVASEFYQPLDASMRWFVSPGVQYRRQEIQIWLDGESIAEYKIQTRAALLDVGRVLGDWGEIRAGAYFAFNSGDRRIGDPIYPSFSEHDGGWAVAFRVDTLDSTMLPRRGTWVSVRFRERVESLGSDSDGQYLFGAAARSGTFGRNTITGSVESATTFSDEDATLQSAYFLGGFQRLSGLHTDELVGSRGGLVRLAYYRELAGLDFGALTSRVCVGMSLEAGNAYLEGDPVTWASLRTGGSIFLAAATAIGPAYLAWGFADDGSSQVYLSIGERF